MRGVRKRRKLVELNPDRERHGGDARESSGDREEASIVTKERRRRSDLVARVEMRCLVGPQRAPLHRGADWMNREGSRVRGCMNSL